MIRSAAFAWKASGCLLASALFLGSLERATPAETMVDVAPEGKEVLIELKDASLDDALRKIAAARGFVIEGSTNVQSVLSGRYQGRLPEVLAQLLENENHIIEYSSSKPDGVARIVLLGHSAAKSASVEPVSVAPTKSPQPLPKPEIGPVPAVVPQHERAGTPVQVKPADPARQVITRSGRVRP